MLDRGRADLPDGTRPALTRRGCDGDRDVEIICEKGHSVNFDEWGVRLARGDSAPAPARA